MFAVLDGMRASTNHGDGYSAVAERIRDELTFHSGSECEAQLRDFWPLLWEALEELVRLVERDEAQQPGSPRLFDPP
jgi:hypothetical protein